MPLGSSKISVNKNRLNAGTGVSVIDVTIDQVFSGNTDADPSSLSATDWAPFSPDADTITYNISTNTPNVTMRYIIDGTNMQTSDFTDNTLASNIALDSNGNATITKTITSSTGGGHKEFNLKITRPQNENSVLAQTANVNLYEMIPWDISGGDTIETADYIYPVTADYSNPTVGGARLHYFTTPGNATLTINNYGNLDGNVDLWTRMYHTQDYSNPPTTITNYTAAFWRDDDGPQSPVLQNWDRIVSLVIGGGGAEKAGGGGAGEFGLLHYPRANVGTGTYTVTVGAGSTGSGIGGNSTIFAGNASLSKTAWGGGDGGASSGDAGRPGKSGEDGGSGGGKNISGGIYVGGAKIIGEQIYQNGVLISGPGETDLATEANASLGVYEPPTKFKEFVIYANGHRGSNSGGGGGAGNRGGNPTSGNYNAYGNYSTEEGSGNAGRGLELRRSSRSPLPSNPIYGQAAQNTFNYSPVYNGGTTLLAVAGGSGGTYANDANGHDGYGGGTAQDGVVTVLYPYIPEFRFVTQENLT
jgi:hypothetical protein